MKSIKILISTICFSLIACSNQQLKASTADDFMQIQAEQLSSSNQCGYTQAQAQWITEIAQYQRAFGELHKNIVGQKPGAPEVDFNNYGVLLVSMGQKNTGGYGLSLAQKNLTVRDDELEVTLQWQEPGRGMMVIQVLTSPCLLLKIPKGSFSKIEIKDQRGVQRFSLDVAR